MNGIGLTIGYGRVSDEIAACASADGHAKTCTCTRTRTCARTCTCACTELTALPSALEHRRRMHIRRVARLIVTRLHESCAGAVPRPQPYQAGCRMVQPTSSEVVPMRGGIRCCRRSKRLWHSRGRRQSHRWMSRQMRHSGHARRVAGTDAGWRAPMASAGASANASGSASDASFRYANASTCRCRAKGRNPKHYGALHPPDTNYACLSVPARMSRSRRGHTGQQLFQGSGIDRLDHVRREPGFLRHPHLVVLPPA